ncbi:MAG: hypothetical protein K9M57_06090 [Phycisphaerae bacterium]|nr:hypothetical protein [Phycisphaerae bacterium]
MKLLINGQDIEASPPQDSSFSAALQFIQDNFIPEGDVITKILVDGEILIPQRLNDWKELPISDFDEANVFTESCKSFSAKGLRIIAEELIDSDNHRKQLVEQIGQGHSEEAMTLLTDYLNVWNVVQQTLGSACRLMRLEIERLDIYESHQGVSPKSRPLTDYFEQISHQLEAIKSALEAGDLVMISDILDYEFGDITDTWHTMLLQLADQFDPKD